MFSGLFGKKSTTKPDVVMAIFGALFATWKAYDTVKTYKEEQKELNA